MEGQPGNGDIIQDMDAAFRGMARLELWREFNRVESLVPKQKQYACFNIPQPIPRLYEYIVYLRGIRPGPIDSDTLIRNRRVLDPEHVLQPEHDSMECTALVKHSRGFDYYRETVPGERYGWALPHNTPLIKVDGDTVTLAMHRSTLMNRLVHVPLTDERGSATPEQIGVLVVGGIALKGCTADTLDTTITHLRRFPED